MSDKLIPLDDLNMSDDELFSVVEHNTQTSEKITAPRYSYWQSVFRVFFKKKINTVILILLAIIIVFTYIYPTVIGYDAEVNPYINLDAPTVPKHLGPAEAIKKLGISDNVLDELYNDSYDELFPLVTKKMTSSEKESYRIDFNAKVDKLRADIDGIRDGSIKPVSNTTIASALAPESLEIITNYGVTETKLFELVEVESYGFFEKLGAKISSNIHWILGSGGSGQSTFDAIWYGSSISISLALVCALINMTIGVIIGSIWGFSKKVDIFMTEVYNIATNIPYILLISVLVLILSASFWTMVFALTVTGWLTIAYFIRTQVIIIRDREYNLASRCLGTPIFRIATKNILPFMTSVIVTLAAAEIPSYISYEVFLSYIGMGLKDMSLGRLIESAEAAMSTPGWEIEFWAPVAISSIIAIVLYVVGQNLGDASDPRTHM